MELNFQPINLSEISLYTLLLIVFFFVFRQYLTSSISEKIKYDFSKELKALETNLNRTSTISVQHRELERNAVIEFHSICIRHASLTLFKRVGKYEKDKLHRYLDIYNETHDFTINGFQSLSSIQLLVTSEELVSSSGDLMKLIVLKNKEYQKRVLDVLLKLELLRQENEKGLGISSNKIEELKMAIDEKVNNAQNYQIEIAAELKTSLKSYRDLAKQHLLA